MASRKSSRKSSRKGSSRASARRSSIPEFRLRRRKVNNGTIAATSGGMHKEDIRRNSRGRLVSRKASASARKRYNSKKSGVRLWNKAARLCGYFGEGEFRPLPRKGTAEHNKIMKAYQKLKAAAK